MCITHIVSILNKFSMTCQVSVLRMSTYKLRWQLSHVAALNEMLRALIGNIKTTFQNSTLKKYALEIAILPAVSFHT